MDVENVIKYFKDNKSIIQLRWYPSEIANVIQQVLPNNQALVDYFRNHKEYLFYRDEIIPEINKFLEQSK